MSTAALTSAPTPYEPPRPIPLGPVAALVRAMRRGDKDLLSLLPAEAYTMPVGPLGYSRRQIVIVNDPQLVRQVMLDPDGLFPKNDLMVGALAPLVGDSIFVSDGETWRRQRRMIDPAFTQMRLNRAFGAMTAAVDDYCDRLDDAAASGEPISLDLAMSHLTADIICRTVFSTSLDSHVARHVFEDFSHFERSVAHVDYRRLIFGRAWDPIPHQDHVLAACRRIRESLGAMLDTHLEATGETYNDIAAMVIGARDPDSGAAFTREELIDELGVFFLAGHETTASGLTWAFYILAVQEAARTRLREEVAQVVGDGPVSFEHTKRLTYARNVFRETLRLYPPITFIPRVARAATRIGTYKVKKGAMVMLSPWTLHRNAAYWAEPHRFDPDRFAPEREGALTPNAYIPFGQGPRICVGAGFAGVESALILARLMTRYDFEPLAPEAVEPAARLTTRPKDQILCRVRRREPREIAA